MKRKEILQGIILTMQKELPFPVLERDIKLPVSINTSMLDPL